MAKSLEALAAGDRPVPRACICLDFPPGKSCRESLFAFKQNPLGRREGLIKQTLSSGPGGDWISLVGFHPRQAWGHSTSSRSPEHGKFPEARRQEKFLVAAAGTSIGFLSLCFVTRCAVTYRSLQTCDKNFQPHTRFDRISCHHDQSGLVHSCCPENWEHFQTSCYYFSVNTMNWGASVRNCSGMGAQLVVINSLEEQEFLYYAKPKKREFFIGLSDQVVEGKWQWVDDTPLRKLLSFWDESEPNNLLTVEDCATIRDSPNPRKNWNDIPCLYNMPRVCEMPEIPVWA
ncbi:C-type lectin domain family 4 member E [Thomomys bottae]